MALIFYPENHTYWLDGKEIPSVTHILRFLPGEAYKNVPQYLLDEAADRGRRIHEASEAYDLLGQLPDSEEDADIYWYLIAYAAFCADYSPLWIEIETPITNGEVAGTVDRIGKVRGIGSFVTVDIKSTVKLDMKGVSAQTFEYSEIYEKAKFISTETYYLHLKDDGTYLFKPSSRSVGRRVWDACYHLHKIMEEPYGE